MTPPLKKAQEGKKAQAIINSKPYTPHKGVHGPKHTDMLWCKHKHTSRHDPSVHTLVQKTIKQTLLREWEMRNPDRMI